MGGIPNEENPVVYVDLTTTNYFQFIGNDEPGIGHLDGLLPTDDSLFLADLTATGDTNAGGDTGAIYQIKSLLSHVLSFRFDTNTLWLGWSGGLLQQADSLSGPWNDVQGATSPYPVTVDPSQPQAFYRTKY